MLLLSSKSLSVESSLGSAACYFAMMKMAFNMLACQQLALQKQIRLRPVFGRVYVRQSPVSLSGDYLIPLLYHTKYSACQTTDGENSPGLSFSVFPLYISYARVRM